MSVYNDDLSSALENSRNSLRRIARHSDTEFSKDSVIKDMERFVHSVNAMDETVLVPRRLMNLAPPGSGDGDDLFRLYSMLNELKLDVLWSRGDEAPVRTPKRVTRRPSASSLCSASSTSSASSTTSACIATDSDSEASCGDSGVDGAGSDVETADEAAARAAAACRRHLRGLRRSLRHLTQAAEQLTERYQEDVSAPL